MKNVEIVRALPKLPSLKNEMEWTKQQITRLQKQYEQLQHETNVLRRVTTIIDGVAVSQTTEGTIYGKDFNIHSVGHDIDRSAKVYTNANTKSDAGIHIYWREDGNQFTKEEWLNTGWAFKDAVEVARRWVVHRELPTKDQMAMAIERHRLDPKGTSTKKRREAFEAAWLAGHKDLAAEILAGRAKLAAKRGSHEQPEAV